MIEFILEISLKKRITNLAELFVIKPVIELHFQETDHEFIAWGDPIIETEFKGNLSKNLTPEFIVNNLYAHFSFILLNKSNLEIFAGNSMFSILPLYYLRNDDKIVISDNALRIGRNLNIEVVSKRFILETILFNYPLFNGSIF